MTKCFVCNSSSTETILDLGKSPVANNLELDKTKSQKSKKYALNLILCKSKCTHVQIGKIVDQKEIFNDYYYMPSISKTLTDHLQSIPKDINQRFKIKKDSFIVDIGSNDGTFLESASHYSKKILGIDPAKNLSDLANKKGIKTINNFFSSDLSKAIKNDYGYADFIVSTNTFAHTPEVNDFVKGLNELISDEGVIIIEIHYLGLSLIHI